MIKNNEMPKSVPVDEKERSDDIKKEHIKKAKKLLRPSDSVITEAMEIDAEAAELKHKKQLGDDY